MPCVKMPMGRRYQAEELEELPCFGFELGGRGAVSRRAGRRRESAPGGVAAGRYVEIERRKGTAALGERV